MKHLEKSLRGIVTVLLMCSLLLVALRPRRQEPVQRIFFNMKFRRILIPGKTAFIFDPRRHRKTW